LLCLYNSDSACIPKENSLYALRIYGFNGHIDQLDGIQPGKEKAGRNSASR
jgi:hypothetical protein